MNSNEFLSMRNNLGKSQAQMARLLGISSRAVQSFEQGWRRAPPVVERQMLFLYYMNKAPTIDIKPCWQKLECDLQIRKKCLAREFQAGHICWFINGTICEGQIQENWGRKTQICKTCDIFKSVFSDVS